MVNIFLVETNKKMSGELAHNFEDKGHTCKTFNKFIDALSECEKQEMIPEVIVTSLNTPIMNGHSYIQAQINSFNFYAKHPLVLVLPNTVDPQQFQTCSSFHHLINASETSEVVETVLQIVNHDLDMQRTFKMTSDFNLDNYL